MKFIVMDHGTDPVEDHEISFEDFTEKLKAWIAPGYWINVQFSDGSPEPIENLSLIAKAG